MLVPKFIEKYRSFVDKLALIKSTLYNHLVSKCTLARKAPLPLSSQPSALISVCMRVCVTVFDILPLEAHM